MTCVAKGGLWSSDPDKFAEADFQLEEAARKAEWPLLHGDGLQSYVPGCWGEPYQGPDGLLIDYFNHSKKGRVGVTTFALTEVGREEREEDL